MSHEITLRRMAQKGLATGKLPRRRPERMWGGPGSGLTCAVCGLTVRPDEMGFDLEFADQAGASVPATYNLHVRCFAAWEFERDSTELNNLQAHPGQRGLPAGSGNGTIFTHERDRLSRGDAE